MVVVVLLVVVPVLVPVHVVVGVGVRVMMVEEALSCPVVMTLVMGPMY